MLRPFLINPAKISRLAKQRSHCHTPELRFRSRALRREQTRWSLVSETNQYF